MEFTRQTFAVEWFIHQFENNVIWMWNRPINKTNFVGKINRNFTLL